MTGAFTDIPMTYGERMAANKHDADIRQAHNIIADMIVDFENDLANGVVFPTSLVSEKDHDFLINIFQPTYPVEFEKHMDHFVKQGVTLFWGSVFNTVNGPVIDVKLKMI